jgi:osmotically inducible protein OsmC
MTLFEKFLHSAKARATDGRDSAPRMAAWTPPGSPGAGTNPRQLFAAGWSASLLSAIKIVAANTKVVLPAEPFIDAEIDLATAHGVFGVAARLNVSVPAWSAKLPRAWRQRTKRARIPAPRAATSMSRSPSRPT